MRLGHARRAHTAALASKRGQKNAACLPGLPRGLQKNRFLLPAISASAATTATAATVAAPATTTAESSAAAAAARTA